MVDLPLLSLLFSTMKVYAPRNLFMHVTHPKCRGCPKVKTDLMQSGDRCFAFSFVARSHNQKKCWRLYIKIKVGGFLLWIISPMTHAWHSTKKLQSVSLGGGNACSQINFAAALVIAIGNQAGPTKEVQAGRRVVYVRRSRWVAFYNIFLFLEALVGCWKWSWTCDIKHHQASLKLGVVMRTIIQCGHCWLDTPIRLWKSRQRCQVVW